MLKAATVAAQPGVTLSDEELRAVTQYVQPARQLAELRRQGFYRARRGRDGSVILERAHYEAVATAEPKERRRAA
jgi:hypothetical protein